MWQSNAAKTNSPEIETPAPPEIETPAPLVYKGISSGPDNAVVEMEKGVPQKTARGVVSFFKKPTPRIILPYSKMDNQSTSPSWESETMKTS